MKLVRSTCWGAAALVLLAAGSAAQAQQFSKPEEAIAYRQGAFNVMGAHFGPIVAMATGKAPFDARSAAANAEVVAFMAKLPWAGFGPGTDKGRPTKAKAEIWSDNAKFKAGADKLQTETAKLSVAAKSGNLDQLKVAFAETAKTCKSCHDSFRSK